MISETKHKAQVVFGLVQLVANDLLKQNTAQAVLGLIQSVANALLNKTKLS